MAEKNRRALCFPGFMRSDARGRLVIMNHGVGMAVLESDVEGTAVGVIPLPWGHAPSHGYADFDAAGNLYIAEWQNHRVRRITAAGVPFNLPPTAHAGSDQSIHAGEVDGLTGAASFDDNTATADLDFAWSFVERPGDSTVALPNQPFYSYPEPL